MGGSINRNYFALVEKYLNLMEEYLDRHPE